MDCLHGFGYCPAVLSADQLAGGSRTPRGRATPRTGRRSPRKTPRSVSPRRTGMTPRERNIQKINSVYLAKISATTPRTPRTPRGTAAVPQLGPMRIGTHSFEETCEHVAWIPVAGKWHRNGRVVLNRGLTLRPAVGSHEPRHMAWRLRLQRGVDTVPGTPLPAPIICAEIEPEAQEADEPARREPQPAPPQPPTSEPKPKPKPRPLPFAREELRLSLGGRAEAQPELSAAARELGEWLEQRAGLSATAVRATLETCRRSDGYRGAGPLRVLSRGLRLQLLSALSACVVLECAARVHYSFIKGTEHPALTAPRRAPR